MTRQFTCEGCGGTFDTDEADDELAEEEMLREHGYVPPEDRAVICDECYRLFEEHLREKPARRTMQ